MYIIKNILKNSEKFESDQATYNLLSKNINVELVKIKQNPSKKEGRN